MHNVSIPLNTSISPAVPSQSSENRKKKHELVNVHFDDNIVEL